MDGVFLRLAGLLLRISLGLCPREIPWSSPTDPQKTLSIPPLLLGLTNSKSRILCADSILLLKTLRSKIPKKSLNMAINWVKMDKKLRNISKIMNFPACTYKSQNVAQSQQKCAPSHNGETVTFRNSDADMCPCVRAF